MKTTKFLWIGLFVIVLLAINSWAAVYMEPFTGLPNRMPCQTATDCSSHYCISSTQKPTEPATLKETNSKTSGTVGGDDLVWVRARASDAVGLGVTQYGQPGYLAYVDRSAGVVTAGGEEVWIRYRCVAPGSNIQLRVSLVQNGQVVRSVTKYVSCTANVVQNPNLVEISSKATGTVGNTGDSVWIVARATNAMGMTVSQYGQPGYLAYVDRSAGAITKNDQNLWVVYTCVSRGVNMPLKLRLVSNGLVVSEVSRLVVCN